MDIPGLVDAVKEVCERHGTVVVGNGNKKEKHGERLVSQALICKHGATNRQQEYVEKAYGKGTMYKDMVRRVNSTETACWWPILL